LCKVPRQTDLAVIGADHDVVLILELEQRRQRPERLLGGNSAVFRHVNEHRGLEKAAVVVSLYPRAADQDFCPAGDGIVDVALHLGDTPVVDKRPNVGALGHGVADLESLDFLSQSRCKLVVDLGMDKDPVLMPSAGHYAPF
jgi:hypothetical protein